MSFATRYLSSFGQLSKIKQFQLFPALAGVLNGTNAGGGYYKQEQTRNAHSKSTLEADTSHVVEEVMSTRPTSGLQERFSVTAEVAVSKIFPAGFGWQSSSILAENMGFAPESMKFALTTGAGDGIGVFLGHTLYFSAKKSLTSGDIDMAREKDIGILLGTAGFFSGTAWQPLVNALQGANLSFSEVFFGTWVGCGAAFYAGLRCSRTILSGFLDHVNEPTYDNSKHDISLSIAIGGATGFFVGTDASYLPDQNFLIDIVGIKDGMSDLTGCAVAGTSTAMGFTTAQTVENLVFPTGKCWND